MIFKELTDPIHDIHILSTFLSNPNIPSHLKSNIEWEIKKIKAGYKAQSEAAYNINFHLKDSLNFIVLHDLRIVHNGRTAQIDQLLINRCMEFYVCETKNFSEGISFNDNLEFTSFFNNKPQGISSPIEQNNNHITVLHSLFKDKIITSPKRLGFDIPGRYHNIILISNNARITRAANTKIDPVNILKNDQFITFLKDEKRIIASDILKLVSSNTIYQISEKLLSLHTPIQFDWIKKFQLETYLSHNNSTSLPITKKEPNNKSFCCAVCHTPLDNSVLFWCRKNKAKFNNQLLCRLHQYNH